MRLNKFLANSGLGSRRECDVIIQKDGVIIDGEKITNPAHQVEESCVVVYKQKEYSLIEKVSAIILHKPLNYLTSLSDDRGRKTIYDLLPKQYRNYKYAGRLDYNSTGLILLFNKSEYAEKITNPKHKVEKEYFVECQREISDNDILLLQKGVELDDGIMTLPAKLKRINKTTAVVKISEGKKRQVRRMFEATDNKVIKLRRDAIGNIKLGNLREGQYKELSTTEIDLLFL